MAEAVIFAECLLEHPVKHAPNKEKTPKHSFSKAHNVSTDVTDNGVLSDCSTVDEAVVGTKKRVTETGAIYHIYRPVFSIEGMVEKYDVPAEYDGKGGTTEEPMGKPSA